MKEDIITITPLQSYFSSGNRVINQTTGRNDLVTTAPSHLSVEPKV